MLPSYLIKSLLSIRTPSIVDIPPIAARRKKYLCHTLNAPLFYKSVKNLDAYFEYCSTVTVIKLSYYVFFIGFCPRRLDYSTDWYLFSIPSLNLIGCLTNTHCLYIYPIMLIFLLQFQQRHNKQRKMIRRRTHSVSPAMLDFSGIWSTLFRFELLF